MSYKIEIQNNFFVVTDTATGIEEIREVRDQVKWRVSGSIYSFFYNIANLVDQNSPNIIRLGENAKEFDFSEIVDSTETPFASRAIFNDLLNVNLGFMIRETSSVWGLITGDINDQTDLQTVLNGKFDVPTGDTTQYIAGDGTLITFPVAGQAGTLVREVKNKTGATLTKGTIVYINGANGNKPTVAKALATSDATSAQTFGFLQTDIANNAVGYAVVMGDLIGLDTSAITEGTQLYLSSTVAGNYTTTKQVAPAHLVYVGIVTRSHPTLGQIEVKIQNGYELDELHDVLIVGETDGQVLQFEGASGLWKNKTLATGLTVGTTTISSGTDGRVLFQNGGVLQQSANFFWDNTNGRLGVGTSSPSSPLHISKGGGARINFGDSQNTVSIGSIEEIGDSAIGFFTQINNEKMRINSAGNVGIGQITPTARLDVKAQGALSTDLAFRIRNSANTADWIKIDGTGAMTLSNAGGTGVILAFAKINNGSGYFYGDASSVLTYSQALAVTGVLYLQNGIGMQGYGKNISMNSGTISTITKITMQESSSIVMRPDFNLALTENNLGLFIAPTSTLNPTKKLIKLMDSTLTTTYFTVNGSGQTGIGTDTPTARLHIASQGALSTDIAFKVRNSANTADMLSISGDHQLKLISNGTASPFVIRNSANTQNILEVRQLGMTIGLDSTGTDFLGINVDSSNIWGLRISRSTSVGNGVDISHSLGGYANISFGNKGTIAFALESTKFYSRNWIHDHQFYTGGTSHFRISSFTAGNIPVFIANPYDALDANRLVWNYRLFVSNTATANGTSMNASAKVQIDSTTQGFLPPRMTNAERTAIASPAVGLMVYCTDAVEGLYVYKSTGWTFVI
jgi:hypothetical protein